jgi:hypothetical protein
MMDEYETVMGLAKRWRISESFIRKAIAGRRLLAVRVGGSRAIRIRVADAERFLIEGRTRQEAGR